MSELLKRAITGAVYVLLTLGAAYAGPVTTTLLFLPVCVMAAIELHRLIDEEAPPYAATWPAMAAALVYLASALTAIVHRVTPLFTLAVVMLVILVGVAALLWDPAASPRRAMGKLLLMVFLIGLPFGLIPVLLMDGPELFVGFMLLLWTNDTGAYLVGRAIGRTGLLRRVSPKKTVEGLVGGILLAMGVGFLLSRTWTVLDATGWLVAALVVAVASTLGDLLESAFKREAGVKDSGHILPGHGGILDRFDGFLLAMPAMVVVVQILR